MAFVTTADGIVQLTMSFSGEFAGWNEKLYFPGPFTLSMVTLAQNAVRYRLRFLPKGCDLDYARLTTLGKPRGSAEVDEPYPVSGDWTKWGDTVVANNESYEHTNNEENAIKIRFEDGNENYAIRWIHGIPDNQIKRRRLIDTVATGTSSPPTLPAHDDDTIHGWGEAVGDYLAWVKTNSVMARHVRYLGTTVWGYAVPVKVICKGFGEHKVGGFFGTPVGRRTHP